MCGFDPFKAVGRALASIDPGPSIGNALAKIDPGPAIGGALAELDSLVGDVVPGGWGTIAKIGLTSVGVPAYISNGLVTVAEGVHRGQSPEQALLNGVKSGAITYGLGELQNLIGNIQSTGVDNVISDWEFAADNGSFADAGLYFADNYVAPAVSGSGGKSFDELVRLTEQGSTPLESLSSPGNSERLFSDLAEQIKVNEAAGMSRQTATDRALADFSSQLGTTENNLLNVIGTTKTGLSTDIRRVESALLDKISVNEAAGMSRDQALNNAIQGLSTDLGLTEGRLLTNLGLTRNDLVGRINDVSTNLGGRITSLASDFTDFSDWTRTQEEQQKREREGKESVDLLSQMATGSVKTPPVAKIDYLYDISGDSIFATPKQESLMPSPFEETPEAVEGAMPRYQYYAPGGGYQFSGGGMVAFEEGGDVTQEELEAALRPVTYNQKLAAYGEQRRAQQPEKEMSADDLMLAEIAAGFHPVIGPALSAKDFEEARGENNYLGMGLAGLGMIPVLGGAVKGYNRLVKPALQRRAAQRADTEMVERYGKIPEGEPVPKGYFGGPPVGRERVSLLDTADQVNYYSSPKFQTQYGKEFTHDLVHGSPSSEVMAFNPRASGAQDELARESSSYFNPLLTARRSSDDTTTFLSPDAMYSDQYLPTIASKAPTGYGFPIPKKEYKEGATMYPVSARLGKIFDPESKDALNVTEEFLGTIQRPKNMSAKDFDRNLGDLEKLLKNGDPKVIESPDFSNFLKERGYDSFAFIKKGKGEQVKNYGVFEPSRIRGKFAEFNPEFANSPEIMKAEGGLIGADELQTIDDLYEILRSK